MRVSSAFGGAMPFRRASDSTRGSGRSPRTAPSRQRHRSTLQEASFLAPTGLGHRLIAHSKKSALNMGKQSMRAPFLGDAQGAASRRSLAAIDSDDLTGEVVRLVGAEDNDRLC